MKFSEQWLRTLVNPPVTTVELTAQLTMAGLEVDAVIPVAGAFSGVVVGEVLSVEPHPNAEKLKVCRVNIGADAPLQIVCGASNVAAGLRVPCATVGASLPGGLIIKQAGLRGVDSQGMLCSAKELGMAESSDGLLVLPADATPGANVRDVLSCDDVTIELGLTPNRGDCLSVMGVAREVAVLNRGHAPAANVTEISPVIRDVFPVAIQAPADCPRYAGRVVRGVNARAQTPLWMRERLRRCGVRSISIVVDVTNYVMLELGQPMHAFDLARLSGGIVVRHARAGERIKLLDQREIELSAGTLVIADQRAPQALAGIMGGAESAVEDATRDIFLESAFFAPRAIAGRARRYGMHTDSSHRFERGVDPTLQRRAIERATGLILDIAGGKPGPVIDVAEPAHQPRHSPITLRRARIERVLGAVLDDADVAGILTRLGMTVTPTATGWSVIPPSYRFDIALEIDLIEELARVHGYDRIAPRQPMSRLSMRPAPEAHVGVDQIRSALVQRGYQEVITYSFVDPKLQRLLDPAHAPIALANPIAAELSVMRTTTWPGLVQVLLHNLRRQQARVRVFETGLRFVREAGDIRQDPVVGGLVCGSVQPEQWGTPPRAADFFDLKSDVEALFGLTAQPDVFEFVRAEHPALHPGRSAAIQRNGKRVGWIGELHPSLLRELDIAVTPYLFEIDQSAIQVAAEPRFREISKFPSVRRDIAIIVDAALAFGDIARHVRSHAPATLVNLELFDVYTGKGIEPGRKSLALGLTFQALERTLGDADVDRDVAHVVAGLEQKFGAKLRS